MYTHTISNKLTVFLQLLDELQQNKVIKAQCEEDLRYTLLNRYPVRLIEMPATLWWSLYGRLQSFCLR